MGDGENKNPHPRTEKKDIQKIKTLYLIRVKPIQITPNLFVVQKNFLNYPWKEISLMKKLSKLPNILSFSKHFFEYAFLM